MPRRKEPLLPVVVGESVGLGEKAALVSFIGQFINEHPATARLGDLARGRMAVRIADACQFARLDLGLVLAGKGTKPDAWRVDVFCCDVRAAWREAGLTPTAWEEGDKRSPFMRFVNGLAVEMGLEMGCGSLINNAKRAGEIERV